MPVDASLGKLARDGAHDVWSVDVALARALQPCGPVPNTDRVLGRGARFWVVRIAAGESVPVTVGAVAFTLAALSLLVASQPE
jgi:hypothetical protein